ARAVAVLYSITELTIVGEIDRIQPFVDIDIFSQIGGSTHINDRGIPVIVIIVNAWGHTQGDAINYAIHYPLAAENFAVLFWEEAAERRFFEQLIGVEQVAGIDCGGWIIGWCARIWQGDQETLEDLIESVQISLTRDVDFEQHEIIFGSGGKGC